MKLLFVRPLLNAFAGPRFFRKALIILLWILAALVAVGAAYYLFDVWIPYLWNVVTGHGEFISVLRLISDLILLVGAYAVVHVLVSRALSIASVPVGQSLIGGIGPIALRLLGELFAFVTAFATIAGGVFLLARSESALRDVPMWPLLSRRLMQNETVAGIQLVAGGLFTALAGVMLAYLAAEVVAAIARSSSNESAPSS